jgi:hypothetical protein
MAAISPAVLGVLLSEEDSPQKLLAKHVMLTGDGMAELDKGKPVSLEELMLTTLAMADAVTKLLIEKGVITEAEFKQKLLEECAVYRILHPVVDGLACFISP